MIHEPTYRDALRAAWKCTRQHPILLLLGVFATFVGQLGILEVMTRVALVDPERMMIPWWVVMPDFITAPLSTIGSLHLSMASWVAVALFMTVCLGFCFFLLFVSIVSHGALVFAVAKTFRRIGSVPHLGMAWHVGLSHFWRLFGIYLFKKGVIFTTVSMVGFALVNGMVDATLTDLFLFILLFVLAVSVSLVVSFVCVYAVLYVVIEEYPFVGALRQAWRLFMAHRIVSLEIGLIVLLSDVVVSVLLLAFFSVVLVPTLYIWLSVVLLLSLPLSVISVGVIATLSLLVVVFTGAIMTVFSTALWSYLFMRMHKEGIVSRVLHAAGAYTK
jgi:hypothetical protein